MEGEGKEQGRSGLVDGGQQRGGVLKDELGVGHRQEEAAAWWRQLARGESRALGRRGCGLDLKLDRDSAGFLRG